MTILPAYQQFGGMDWERGVIRNALAYQGVTAPHTNAPMSDALLWGISGGSVIGYFPFAYENIDPHLALLINNTFTPFETILKRLKIDTAEKTTGRAPRAAEHLSEVIDAGKPAIVWADIFTMPYNLLDSDDSMWAMFPTVVYGVDDAADRVHIADRSARPLWVTRDEFAAARARTKQNNHRLLTLSAPDFRTLKTAVSDGIRDSITFYTDGAPKGAKENWGLAALQKWAKLLIDEKTARGWSAMFPRGGGLYNGLLTAFHCIAIRGVPAEGAAGRGVMADFLDEAAVVLEKPALKDAAVGFRATMPAWNALAVALLPDEVPLFGETRALERQARDAFTTDGMDSMDVRRAIKTRVAEIRQHMRDDFPLDDAACADLRAAIREKVLAVHEAEALAIEALQQAF